MKRIRWKVRNGEMIQFWWDNQVDNVNLVELLGIYNSMRLYPQCKVTDFTRHNKTWDIAKL